MSILKRSELLAYANLSKLQNFAALDEAQARDSRSKQTGTIRSVFLSHSHADKDLVRPAVIFFKEQGVQVYVDWMDGEMPSRTSGETAKRLKSKISENDRFVVLVSEHSKESHWVPWELGLADGVKGMRKIASFPIRSDEREFKGNEYFSIYPRIELINGTYYVWTDDPLYSVPLRTWLQGV